MQKKLRSVFLKIFSRAFNKSPELTTKSIRINVLVFIHYCTNHDLNLKTLIQGHHSGRNECFIKAFSSCDCIEHLGSNHTPTIYRCQIKLGL